MEKSLADARQTFLEQYGSARVANNYLLVAVVCVSLALLGSIGLTVQTLLWAKNQKPLVVRIDEVGRATPVDYRSFDYRPQDRELRYFLGQFVYLHFSRFVSTVEERYSKSLFFVDEKLSRALIEEERKSMSIAKFVKEGGDEIDIVINNIVLQDLRGTPMKATVDFDKVFLSRGQHREIRRERHAGSFEFIVHESLPNAFVLVNPLGLTITYFRTDVAFKQ
jgi:type IV secretory pathway TrbF-like protein